MKQLWFLICILMLASCERFNVKKKSSEAILNEELKTFNWDEVDQYPTFTLCDSLLSNKQKRNCFEYELKTQIVTFFKNQTIAINNDINDTINLSLQVSEKGEISLLDFEVDSLTAQEIPNIKSLIYKSLDTLPQIFPAIKRGQQVRTKFELPIIISVK